MTSLDELGVEEERVLVVAALDRKAARAKLQKHARVLATAIASFYRERGQRTPVKRMTGIAMQQFNAVLNEYGNRLQKRNARRCRFSLYFAHWATMRIEWLVQSGR
jgi:hypothetical protein